MNQHTKRSFLMTLCMLVFGILIQLFASYIVYENGFGNISGMQCKKCSFKVQTIDARITSSHWFGASFEVVKDKGDPVCSHSFSYYGGHADGSIPNIYFILVRLSWCFFYSAIIVILYHIWKVFSHYAFQNP